MRRPSSNDSMYSFLKLLRNSTSIHQGHTICTVSFSCLQVCESTTWLLSNVLFCCFPACREFKSLIEVLAVVGEKIDQGNFNSKGDDLSTALKVIINQEQCYDLCSVSNFHRLLRCSLF